MRLREIEAELAKTERMNRYGAGGIEHCSQPLRPKPIQISQEEMARLAQLALSRPRFH